MCILYNYHNLSEEYYINVNIKYYDINNSIYITRFYD